MANVNAKIVLIRGWVISVLTIAMLAVPVHAQTVPLQIPISGKDAIEVCVGELCGGIAEYIAIIYHWLVGFAALLAVLAITWGGVQWLISRGESGKIQEAQKIIGNAVIGLAIALLSYLLLATIRSDLVTFNPLTIRRISSLELELEEVRETVFSSGGGLHEVSRMSANPSNWDSLLQSAAAKHNVDCTFAKAIMIQESSGDPNAVSYAGAVGLMQVMSSDADRVLYKGRPSKAELLDPATGVEWGFRILTTEGGARYACNGRRSGNGCDVTPLGGSLAGIDPARVKSDPAYQRALEVVAAAYNGGSGHNQYSKEPSCRGILRWECPANPKLYKQTLPYSKRIVENFLELKSKGWGC